MESDHRSKKPKNAWISSNFGVCNNLENVPSDSDINGVKGKSKIRPVANVQITTASRSATATLDIGGHPLGRDDLAVHKKKVDEVDAWLIQAYDRPVHSKQPMMLLMTGPTGAGKTATLKVLAASKQIQILEWINPMDEIVENDRWPQGPNQASKFEDFLISSARYNSLCSSHSKKLILVEDYPNSLLLNPDLFHNIIKNYQHMGKSPLVFITTEVNSGQNISYNLFPPKIVNELNIQNISFNPIAFTSLMKALNNIIKHQSLSNVSSEMQSAICYSCNGDIRNAVLALQYLAQDTHAGSYKMKKPIMPKSRKRKAESVKGKVSSKIANNTGLEGKDCLTGMMHSVGRVLHAKREASVVNGGGADRDKRGYLKSDPQEIVAQFLSQCRHFVSIVHENYHSIFSDIHSVAKATESICDGDILMNDWTERDLLKEVGFSVAVRGVMNACNNPVQRWNPLQKPKWKEVMLKTNEYLRNMQSSSSKMSFCDKALCMDLALFHDSNVSRPNPCVQSGTVDAAPVSPLPHITDDESD